jgi:hypothetical protein
MKLRLLSALGCTVGPGLLMSFGALQTQSPPEFELTRDLRIDAGENNLASIFPPGGIAVSTHGTIVVTQNQDGTLRFFDPSGKPLGTFGRKGQGPGEFQSMGGLAWIGDTLLASDSRTRRYTLVAPDRTFVRTVLWMQSVSLPPRPGGEPPRIGPFLPRARYGDGSMLITANLATGSAAADWPGGEKPGTPFIRVDSSGAFRQLIAWSPRVQCEASFDAGAGPGSGSLVIPFCHRTLEELSPDGNVLVFVSGATERPPAFHVSAFRANGETMYSRSVVFQPVAIPKSVADSARAARARGSQSQREAATKMQIPATYPPFARLIVGRDESTWIESYGPGGERFWYVLDNRGIVTGRARVPANVHLMVVSRSTVWGIETDTDGLQSVVRYRVQR